MKKEIITILKKPVSLIFLILTTFIVCYFLEVNYDLLPKSDEARIKTAAKFKEQKKYNYAITRYQNLVESDPDNSDYIFSLAALYNLNGEHQECIDYLDEALNILDGNHYLIKTYSLFELGKKEEADLLLAKILEVHATREDYIDDKALMFIREKYTESEGVPIEFYTSFLIALNTDQLNIDEYMMVIDYYLERDDINLASKIASRANNLYRGHEQLKEALSRVDSHVEAEDVRMNTIPTPTIYFYVSLGQYKNYEIRINGELYEHIPNARLAGSSSLGVENIEFLNEIFDVELILTDYNGQKFIYTSRNVVLFEGNLDKLAEIENYEEIEHFMQFNPFDNPSGDIKVFEGVKNLKSILLRSKNVSGDISVFSEMPNLEKIDLLRSPVNGDLKSFKNLIKLKFLDLSSSQVEGELSNLDGMIDLNYLNLNQSNVNGSLKQIESLSNIERLSLRGTDISGNLDNLLNLNKLKSINLSYTDVDGELSIMNNFVSLDRIELNSTKVSGSIDDLTSLNDLAALFINNTKIDGKISSLSKMNRLMYIHMNNTNVTGDITSLINLKYLRYLYVKDTSIYGDVSKLVNIRDKMNIMYTGSKCYDSSSK